jgi:hypothetical protein
LLKDDLSYIAITTSIAVLVYFVSPDFNALNSFIPSDKRQLLYPMLSSPSIILPLIYGISTNFIPTAKTQCPTKESSPLGLRITTSYPSLNHFYNPTLTSS